MQSDNQGFLYPHVNSSLCAECGRCVDLCPLKHEYVERIPLHTYAVKNSDEGIRLNSSSGGVFTILAEQIIKEGGVVYGAVFDKDWTVKHDRIDKVEDIDKLRGSKYVQSRMEGIYPNVKKDLNAGLKVLFSGTHCHIAALFSFLGGTHQNLITVDVICGGVPSPRIWRDYLKEEIKAFKAAVGNNLVTSSLNDMSCIRDISFRNKSNGWKKFRFVLHFIENPTECNPNILLPSCDYDIWEHTFMLSWLKGYISRPACHACHFRKGRSGADYTIADYWCVEQNYPKFADDKGVSMFLIYDGAMPLYMANKCESIDTKFEHAAYGQRCVLDNHPYNPTSKLYFFLHDRCHFSLSRTLVICLSVDKGKKLLEQYRETVKHFMKRIRRFVKRIWQKF